jgi:Tfp pilus assembly protein PilF
MKNRYLLPASGALLIALITCLLYIPFLNNAITFDDHNLFTRLAVYDFVIQSLNFHPRTFPYYTLGVVQVLFGSIEAHRIVSLILHILCAWMLFALLATLLSQAMKTAGSGAIEERKISNQAQVLALIGAAWFAINPVAVYGAGYLVQRTILFATLFSLLSLWYYRRAFAENRTSDIVAAALFYSAAVLSKEHAIMLPLAAVPLTALYGGEPRLKAKRIGLYLLLCIPAAVTVVFVSKYAVGTGYEPSFGAFSSRIQGIPFLNTSWGPWLVSSLMQAGFFFDYFTYWIVPDVRSMSIDMRVDFTGTWSAWWFFPKAALFLASPVAAMYLLRRGGLAALFGCGFLYSWLLFATEVVTVRFQEPFVLYRSYLWAPGYILMIVAACRAVPRRWVVATSVPLLIVCFGLAHERLKSLATQSSVWEDAGAKLESESVLGADRIFYNRGLSYLKENKFNDAVSDFSRAIPHNPKAFYYFYHRGIAYYSLNEFEKAQADFDHALTLNKRSSATHFARGMMFERRGCIDAARRAYATSMNLGSPSAKLRLNYLAKSPGPQEEKKQGECS